jgi:hypothetical protein
MMRLMRDVSVTSGEHRRYNDEHMENGQTSKYGPQSLVTTAWQMEEAAGGPGNPSIPIRFYYRIRELNFCFRVSLLTNRTNSLFVVLFGLMYDTTTPSTWTYRCHIVA